MSVSSASPWSPSAITVFVSVRPPSATGTVDLDADDGLGARGEVADRAGDDARVLGARAVRGRARKARAGRQRVREHDAGGVARPVVAGGERGSSRCRRRRPSRRPSSPRRGRRPEAPRCRRRRRRWRRCRRRRRARRSSATFVRSPISSKRSTTVSVSEAPSSSVPTAQVTVPPPPRNAVVAALGDEARAGRQRVGDAHVRRVRRALVRHRERERRGLALEHGGRAGLDDAEVGGDADRRLVRARVVAGLVVGRRPW